MGDSGKKEKKSGVSGFFKTVSAEFKKIVWPSKDSLLRQSFAVTIISVVLGLLVAGFDYLVQFGINFITK